MTNLRDPLTPEQLREKDGHPVWVEFEDGSGGLWGIVHMAVFAQIVFANGLHCTIGQPYYGKTYKAYAYPPAHIDREAWERCWTCRWVVSQPNWGGDYKYCPGCGRPLTPEAWTELEKRMGVRL